MLFTIEERRLSTINEILHFIGLEDFKREVEDLSFPGEKYSPYKVRTCILGSFDWSIFGEYSICDLSKCSLDVHRRGSGIQRIVGH